MTRINIATEKWLHRRNSDQGVAEVDAVLKKVSKLTTDHHAFALVVQQMEEAKGNGRRSIDCEERLAAILAVPLMIRALTHAKDFLEHPVTQKHGIPAGATLQLIYDALEALEVPQ